MAIHAWLSPSLPVHSLRFRAPETTAMSSDSALLRLTKDCRELSELMGTPAHCTINP